MKGLKILVVTGLAVVFASGCTDRRLNRSDEDAMAIYRECMNSMPPQVNSADMSATISNASTVNPNTSIAANTATRQEQSQHILCAKQAGYEE